MAYRDAQLAEAAEAGEEVDRNVGFYADHYVKDHGKTGARLPPQSLPCCTQPVSCSADCPWARPLPLLGLLGRVAPVHARCLIIKA